MTNDRPISPQLLLVLVLLVALLLTWTALATNAYSSEPPERGEPATANAGPGQGTLPAEGWLEFAAKVEPGLRKQVVDGAPGGSYAFIVELTPQADPSRQPVGLEKAASGTVVVNALQAVATSSQAGIRAELDARRAQGQVTNYRSFWIFNGIAVTADAETLLYLAARPEVRMIREDRWRRWVEPPLSPKNQVTPTEDEVAWNLAQVRVDLAWSAFGLDGSGVTVAIMDTGVDLQHPALQSQYRGYKAGGLTIHQGNWLCTTDEGYLYPVDANGHGTHVTGTAVGGRDTDGRAIGMAPGARWIAVKMLDDYGYGYDSWIHAAFEWLMAPADDPALAPDIVNASWGSRDAAKEVFRPDVQALRAAGIVPVFAAGNEGPNALTLRSPASFPEAIAVGASDDQGEVANFSSQGPSPWDEIKPEVIAPGTQIRSSHPGGTYGFRSGTSMATPHVAGLAALLRQADPTLSVDEIEVLVTSSAVPLGTDVPNNASGWGRIDAYQAVAVALEAGFVSGQVTRQSDGQPLPTARITIHDHSGKQRAQAQADAAGHYRLALPPGQYDLDVEAFGYASQTVPGVTVQVAVTTLVDLTLEALPSGVLWGLVSNAESGGPVSAVLTAMDTPAVATSDPNTGQYSLALPAGTYSLQVARNGYRRHIAPDLEIVAGDDLRLDVALAPAPTLLFVDSGHWYYGSQQGFIEQALDDNDYVYDVWQIRDLTSDIPNLEDLASYEITIWSSPQDAPGLIGAGNTISNYLSTDGNLLLTGQDIGYWDGGLSGLTWHPYYGRFLRALAVNDNAGRTDVVGRPGDILEDLSLAINGPDSAGNQVTPDEIDLLEGGGAALIADYAADRGAALRAEGCQSYRAVYLAAGLEGLGDRAQRAEVMERSLSWLDSPFPEASVDLMPPRQDKVWLTGTTVTYTVELRNTGQAIDQFDLELSPSAWAASVWDETFSQPLTRSMSVGACQTQTLGLEITVPPTVGWNVTDAVTLTARSLADPGQSAVTTFESKSPAPILLVDGHRWYDSLPDYQAALEANGLPYDVWSRDALPKDTPFSPSLERLANYPLVVWFTAYDWFSTLTPEDESNLAVYLDGGGRLLFSSQDYLYSSGFTDFAGDYFGVAEYREGLTVTQVVGAIGDPVGRSLSPSDLLYPFRNWSDALRPKPAASIAFWGQHGQPTALSLVQSPWKTVFYAFPLEALLSQDMTTVMGQAIEWLSPLGDSSLLVDKPVVADGAQLAYSLEIRNTGPKVLSSVTLSNTIPPGTSYIAGSLTGPASYDPVTDRFTWQGTIAPGQTVTITYGLQVDSGLPDDTLVRNVAYLVDHSGLPLLRVADSRVNAPDLSPSNKLAGGESAVVGQVLTFTLVLQNGGLRGTHATLVDPIPAHTTHLPGSARASSGLITSTDEALSWSGSLSIGHVVTITFPVTIEPDATGLYVYNRASLEDQWSNRRPLEAYTTAEVRVFLPLVLKEQ
jgi:uncharacterized repeat protein (TIGR01451 family)